MGASAQAVDFSGVKDRGAFNPKRVKEGDYAAVVTKVEDAKAKDSGNKMWVFTIKLKTHSQNSYPYRCVLTENQMWKLRNLGIAAGLNVPKKRVKFDPNKIVGKQIGVTMEDDEYDKDGKTYYKSEVAAVFPVSELMSLEYDGDGDSDSGSTEDDDPDEPTAAVAVGGDDAAEDEAPAQPAKEGKKKKDKKGKKKKGSEENLEDLDISDL